MEKISFQIQLALLHYNRKKTMQLLTTFLLFTLIISPFALAASTPASPDCKEQRIFLIEGKSTSLCWLDSLEAWISPACLKKCDATQLSTSTKSKDVNLDSKSRAGGKNPGSVLCAQLGGKVMFATLPSKSQITFCEAKDHSFIDCNALANQYFSKNSH